jgi:hypothetical protein
MITNIMTLIKGKDAIYIDLNPSQVFLKSRLDIIFLHRKKLGEQEE